MCSVLTIGCTAPRNAVLTSASEPSTADMTDGDEERCSKMRGWAEWSLHLGWEDLSRFAFPRNKVPSNLADACVGQKLVPGPLVQFPPSGPVFRSGHNATPPFPMTQFYVNRHCACS